MAQAVDASDDTDVTVAGRILRIRDYGGVLFADLRDWSGEMQVLLDNSRLEQGRTRDFTATTTAASSGTCSRTACRAACTASTRRRTT